MAACFPRARSSRSHHRRAAAHLRLGPQACMRRSATAHRRAQPRAKTGANTGRITNCFSRPPSLPAERWCWPTVPTGLQRGLSVRRWGMDGRGRGARGEGARAEGVDVAFALGDELRPGQHAPCGGAARPEEGSQHQRPCEASRHCPLGARGAREGDVSSAPSALEFGLSPADRSRSRRHGLWDGNDFTPGYG